MRLIPGRAVNEVCSLSMRSAPGTVGLPETLWGAAVPKNYSKILRDVVDEMYGDYDYMVCYAS